MISLVHQYPIHVDVVACQEVSIYISWRWRKKYMHIKQQMPFTRIVLLANKIKKYLEVTETQVTTTMIVKKLFCSYNQVYVYMTMICMKSPLQPQWNLALYKRKTSHPPPLSPSLSQVFTLLKLHIPSNLGRVHIIYQGSSIVTFNCYYSTTVCWWLRP